MKYSGMPFGMWYIYRRSFRKALVNVLGMSSADASRVMKNAKPKYREIIGKLPEFEKGDMFKTNIVNCSILIAVLLNMDLKPSLEEATQYYEQGMSNFATKAFCKNGGKKKYTESGMDAMRKTAAFKAADRNPYSWNMEFIPYEDGSGYEARFTKCGICTLMKEYGLFEYVPAMCHLDYTMSDFSGVTDFIRENTLATGGAYCDNGYKKKCS